MTQYIPVVVCSAHIAAVQERAEVLRDKGYRIVEKPFYPDQLIAAVEELLHIGDDASSAASEELQR